MTTPFCEVTLFEKFDETLYDAFRGRLDELVKHKKVTKFGTDKVSEEIIGTIGISHFTTDMVTGWRRFLGNILQTNLELGATIGYISADTVIDNAVDMMIDRLKADEKITVEDGETISYTTLEDVIVTSIEDDANTTDMLTFFVELDIEENNVMVMAVHMFDNLNFYYNDGIITSTVESEIGEYTKADYDKEIDLARMLTLSYLDKTYYDQFKVVDRFTFGYEILDEDSSSQETVDYLDFIKFRDLIIYADNTASSKIYQAVIKLLPKTTIADIRLEQEETFPWIEVVSETASDVKKAYPKLFTEEDVRNIFEADEDLAFEDIEATIPVLISVQNWESEEEDSNDINDAAFNALGFSFSEDEFDNLDDDVSALLKIALDDDLHITNDAGIIGDMAVRFDQPEWVYILLIPYVRKLIHEGFDLDEQPDDFSLLNEFIKYIEQQVGVKQNVVAGS